MHGAVRRLPLSLQYCSWVLWREVQSSPVWQPLEPLISKSTAFFLTNIVEYVIYCVAMRTLNLQLIGSTPLLLHHISRHQFREQVASQKGATMTMDEEASEVMVKDTDGNPAVPVSWLWDALRVGCSRITVEKKQVSFTKLQSMIKMPEGLLSLKDTDNHVPGWKTYSSFQHAAPGSKKSVAVVAPMFKDWMLIVPVQVPVNVLINNAFENKVLLERIFMEAGRAGIGLFHPPKKHFGQFKATIL